MAVIIRTHKIPRKLEISGVYSALQKELNAYTKDVLLDFEATAVTWKHKVKFQSDKLILPDIVSIKVWTDDEIYGYVDKGTPKRDIHPKPGKRLAFMVGGSPKTHPGQDTAGPGSPGTHLVVLPVDRPVKDHAIKARNFTKEIRKHHQKDFYSRIDKAIRKWTRESGHAVTA